MNVTAELRNGRIEFDAPATARDLLLSIPGCRFGTKDRVWWAPLTWATAMCARGVFGEGLEVGDALDAWGHDQLSRLAVIQEAKDRGTVVTTDGLRDFQHQGVAFLATSEVGILADDRGTGKTVQAIAALRDAGEVFPALVVCPNVMRRTWAKELAKWAPDYTVSVVRGTKPQRVKALATGAADVYVIGWGSLALHTRVEGFGSIKLTAADKTPGELNALGLRTVILDEAHRAKEPDSKQTRAAWYLTHHAMYRWLLTGTPLTASPADLWSLLHAIDPESAPTRSTWMDRYADVEMGWDGYPKVKGFKEATKEELFSWVDPMLLRRSKAEVLPELPERTYTTRWVELEGSQATAYKAMKKEMMAELDSGMLVAVDPLVLRTRLLQLAAATPVLETVMRPNKDTGEPEPRVEVVSLKMPSCKVDALLEIVGDMDGEPLAVFAESRKLIELCSRELAKAGVEHGLITGSVNDADRDLALEKFQAGKLPVILCTNGAGGEGITLHRASTLVCLGRSYRMDLNLQVDDRVYRMGQEADAVTIIDVVAEGTVEELVHEIVGDKEAILQELCRDPEWVRRALT